ncbi:MAG: hypothetical protein J2O44_07905 [Porphyrobacter sp.]|nr:hypothetical protein [Porphyrobacter sp.]
MTAATLTQPSSDSVESLLRDGLAQGDAMLSTTAPILRHLLVNEDQALFSDEVVARVRGMLTDLARQLLHAQAEAARIADHAAFLAEREQALAEALAEESALLTHAHALTLEGGLALRLQTRCNVDPVLCPLLQELLASRDDVLAGLAMALLAAQARFIQHHRRMALPLGELPGDLLHSALLTLRANAGGREDAAVAAERALRDGFDESHGRLALLTRLAMRMGSAAPRALDIDRAGLAIFATALAKASGQTRDLTVLAFSERQVARLALGLRAAGLEPAAVEEQLLYLHPEIALPEGFDQLSAERASALLATSSLSRT